MCECFTKTIDFAKKQLEGKKEINVEWENKTFFLDGKDHAPTVLKVNTEHRQTKTNGNPYRNKTKDSFSVILKYCPMCGTRIEEVK